MLTSMRPWTATTEMMLDRGEVGGIDEGSVHGSAVRADLGGNLLDRLLGSPGHEDVSTFLREGASRHSSSRWRDRVMTSVADDANHGGDDRRHHWRCTAIPVKQLKHEFGYDLGPPNGTAPAITQAEAIEAAHRFGCAPGRMKLI